MEPNNNNLRRALAESRRNAEEAEARALEQQLLVALEESRRKAEENARRKEEENTRLALRASEEQQGAENLKKVTTATNAEYKSEINQTSILLLEGNNNPLMRDAILFALETDAISSLAPFQKKTVNTPEQNAAKQKLLEYKNILIEILNGSKVLDKSFIEELPILLRMNVYTPLGLVRKDVLAKDEVYQRARAKRVELNAKNAEERKAAKNAEEKKAKIIKNLEDERKREAEEADLEAAKQVVRNAESKMKSAQDLLKKFAGNPRKIANSEKATKEFEEAKRAFEAKYPGKAYKGGKRSTRKGKKMKKSKKTRHHK